MSRGPRIRTLKPEAWADERLGRVPRDPRLLWAVCLTMCDDEGRFRAIPAVIVGHGFPYEPEVLPLIEGWLAELAGAGLIQLYEHDGIAYGCFPRWSEHQKIDKATPSRLPAPPVLDESSPSPRRAVDESSSPDQDQDQDLEQDHTHLARERAECEVEEVFNIWKDAAGKTSRTELDETRRRLIRKALKMYPLEDVVDAARGWRHDPFNRGENNRGPNGTGKAFNELDTVLRDAAQIEKFRDLERAEREGNSRKQQRAERTEARRRAVDEDRCVDCAANLADEGREAEAARGQCDACRKTEMGAAA